MSDIEVVPVRERRDLSRFLNLPYSLYRRDPYWVPQLRLAQKELFNRDHHPFYRHADTEFFLAVQAGRVVGRVAAILDRNYNAFHKEEAGAFGFFESVDDERVSGALLGAACDWLKKRGAKVVRGPLNPSTNYECALLIDGFDSSPFVMMPYNPPYYATLIERAGFRKAKDLYAWFVTTELLNSPRVESIADRAVAAAKMRIRPIRSGKAFWEDVERVWEVYNAAWERNWGFVPATRDEFLFMAKDMKSILEPELVLLGEVRDRVVGFALGLPDINRALKHTNGRLFPLGLVKILYHKRSIRTMRVLVLGVMKEYQAAGVAAGFYAELFRRGSRLGYREGEMSWVLEDNLLMNRSSEALGGKRYKTYRIYEWD